MTLPGLPPPTRVELQLAAGGAAAARRAGPRRQGAAAGALLVVSGCAVAVSTVVGGSADRAFDRLEEQVAIDRADVSADRMAGRVVTALAVIGSLVAMPAASAGQNVKRPCAFGDDGRGVIEENFGRSTRNVLGAAIQADDREVTVTIYLAELPASPPAPEDAFIHYTFSFDIGDQRLFLTAPADASSPASYGVRGLVLGQPSVKRDAKAHQIRLTAPLAGFAPLASPSAGDLATRMTAQAVLTVATAATPSQAAVQLIVLDLAEGRSTSYRFGAPSCPRKRK